MEARTVSTLARAQPWSVQGMGVVALCFAVNMVDGMDVTILSYVAPALQQSWAIDADTMGTVFSAGPARHGARWRAGRAARGPTRQAAADS